MSWFYKYVILVNVTIFFLESTVKSVFNSMQKTTSISLITSFFGICSCCSVVLYLGVDQCIQKFLDVARQTECFFLQKRLQLSVQKPEQVIKEVRLN